MLPMNEQPVVGAWLCSHGLSSLVVQLVLICVRDTHSLARRLQKLFLLRKAVFLSIFAILHSP